MKSCIKQGSIIVACAILLLSGCGSTAHSSTSGSSDTTSAQTESSAASDNSGSQSSGQKGSTSSSAQNETATSGLTKTQKALAKAAANKGSMKAFDGQYQIIGSKSSYYTFAEGKICLMTQYGTYSFSTDSAGNHVIKMKFNSAKSATTYSMKSSSKKMILTYTAEGAESSTSTPYVYKSGTNGLYEYKKFNGIYELDGQNEYQMVFKSDGTFHIAVYQTFKTEKAKHKLVLKCDGSKLVYKYKIKKNYILLTNSKGTAVAKLKPTTSIS